MYVFWQRSNTNANWSVYKLITIQYHRTKFNSCRQCRAIQYTVRHPNPPRNFPKIKDNYYVTTGDHFVKTLHALCTCSLYQVLFHLDVRFGSDVHVFIYIMSILRLKHLSIKISVHLTLINFQMIGTRNELRHSLSIEY